MRLSTFQFSPGKNTLADNADGFRLVMAALTEAFARTDEQETVDVLEE